MKLYGVLLFLFVAIPVDFAVGQNSKIPARQLTLPQDMEKPSLSISKEAFFGEVSKKSTLLEVILNKDGSLIGFEKRTLAGFHAKRYEGHADFRRLFHFAANLGKREVVSNGKSNDSLADLDLVVYASSKIPLSHFQKMMHVACEDGIGIYRYHIGVQDKETKKKGILTYHIPLVFVKSDDPDQKDFLSNDYCVTLYAWPKGCQYEFAKPKGEAEYFDSLAELGKRIDVLKKEHPEARFRFTLGGIPLDAPMEKEESPTVQDLVDLMTLLASKGADLKCRKAKVVEYLEILEEEK